MGYSIGVISDTHGNLKLMTKVCDFLSEIMKVNEIFHLGDNYEDYKTIKDMGYNIYGVPGLWDSEYHDNVTPKIIIRKIANKNFIFAHAEFIIKRLNRKDLDVWCYGHTHQPEIRKENSRIYFNPGHLKKNFDRGHPATFGIVNIKEGSIEFTILDIEKNMVQSLNYPLV